MHFGFLYLNSFHRRGTVGRNGIPFYIKPSWWNLAIYPLAVALSTSATFGDENLPGPLAPKEALASFQTHPDLVIELVAAEPLVMDPVAFDWGPDGRLWVVEMRDYPNGSTWNKPDDPHDAPGGRVKVLSDTDGDGQYDKATLFLDNLSYPSGIKVWKDGVLITAAPEIFFARDSDGDGKADQREVWYSGFSKSNQQHRVNGLAWGLDNWLHIANGDGGGVITSSINRDKVDIRGHDLRIDPVTREIQLLSGRTQCGRYRDDWGNWFGCNNSNPLWHYPLRDWLIRRNPLVDAPRSYVDVPAEPRAAPVFPTSRTVERFNQVDRANRFTSVCGPTIYRDDVLGTEFSGNAFICEPVHNLVSRQVLVAKGSTFRSDRAAEEKKSEVIASSDNWSRPVSVRTGPDGALWFTDMYRAVIEHPEWIPHDWQLKLDIRAGHDRGRIYRVKRKGSPTPPPADHSKFVPLEQLKSRNGTRRDLAHQMLLWNDERNAKTISALRELIRSAKNPASRVHAFSVLSGLSELDEDIVEVALQDTHPGVVRNAIRFSAGKISADELFALLEPHLDNGFVAQELSGGATSGKVLAAILTRHGGDPYVTATALSSVNQSNIAPLLEELDLPKTSPGVLESLSKMAESWKKEKPQNLLIAALGEVGNNAPEAWKISVMLGLSGSSQLRDRLSGFAPGILELLRDSKRKETERRNAIRLFPLLVTESDEPIKLLTPTLSPTLRNAIFDSLTRQADPQTASRLLSKWPNLSPQSRSRALTLMLSRGNWLADLLTSLESSTFPANQLDATTRRRLLDSSNPEIKTRSQKIFGSAPQSNRAKIIEAYADVLKMKGTAEAGRVMFGTACAACHHAEGVGNKVGPDLTALTDRSPEAMLTAILDPNRAVEDKFTAYLITKTSGEQFYGMIESEDANSLTLRSADGSPHKISRTTIKKIHASGLSLMPEGMEATMSKEQLADVIAYVGSLGGEKSRPEVLSARIRPGQGGVIELRASKCRLAGKRIEYMADFDAIGWWTSSEDRAEWTIVLDRPGKYKVEWEWSVSDKAAGNGWQILGNGRKILSGKVNKSGSWETFKVEPLGEIELQAADTKIVLKSEGKVNQALLDLRFIRFTPISE